MKHAWTGTNYVILTKPVKRKQEKKFVSSLKTMQTVSFEQVLFSFHKNNFFIGKNP